MSRPARPLAAAAGDRLRDAAAEAFARSGLDGASLNEILRRAHMGKSSFYHRFADKAALHDWVTESLQTALLREVCPPAPRALTAATFRPELSRLLDRIGRIATTHPELMDLGRMFHNSVDVPAERAIAGTRRAVVGWVTEVLKTGCALGTVRNDLPVDLLTTWAIASLTAIDQWMLTTTAEETVRRAAAETALSDLWRLLSLDPAPSGAAAEPPTPEGTLAAAPTPERP